MVVKGTSSMNSVFSCMTAAQINAVQNNIQLDVTSAIQEAINKYPVVYFPVGDYYTGLLKMKTWTCLVGEHGRITRVHGIHSGTILEYPTDNLQCKVENICFYGLNCTAISVNTQITGPLVGYLNQFYLNNCNISSGMTFGIDASMLCSTIENSTFGVVFGNSNNNPLCAIRSHAFGNNVPNLNKFKTLVFNHCGNNNIAAVDLFGGVGANFSNCDWEGCGRVLKLQSMAQVSLSDCWFERNSSLDWLIYAGESFTPLSITRTQFQNNNIINIIECDDINSAGVELTNNFFGFNDNSFPIYFSGAKTHDLLQGKLVWSNNCVVGGSPKNNLTSLVRKMEVHNMQGWARISTSTPNIDCHSDSNAYVIRNGIGDVTIILATPFCSNIYTSSIIANSVDSDNVLVRAWSVSQNSIRLRATKNGVLHDCTISLQWAGR